MAGLWKEDLHGWTLYGSATLSSCRFLSWLGEGSSPPSWPAHIIYRNGSRKGRMAPPSDHILPHLSSPRTHQTNKQPQHLKHLGIHQQPIGRGPRSSTTWLMHYEGRQSTKGSGFAPRGRTQPTSDNQPSQCAGGKNKPRIPKPNLAKIKLNRPTTHSEGITKSQGRKRNGSM